MTVDRTRSYDEYEDSGNPVGRRNVQDKPRYPDKLVYTDVDRVEKKLRRDFQSEEFEDTEDAIRSAQNEIDRIINHAFRPRIRVERKDRNFDREFSNGYPVFLERMNVRELERLDVNTGREETEFVSDPSWTKGRTKDYWVENLEGKVFIRSVVFDRTEWLRIQYLYGEERQVPPDVRQAATLMAAAELLSFETGNFTVTDTGDDLSVSNKRETYRNRATNILQSHKKMVPIT